PLPTPPPPLSPLFPYTTLFRSDEAFLRRIRYKLEVTDPSATDFREIFRRICHERQVPYEDGAVTYLLMHRYPGSGQVPRACHPRDRKSTRLNSSHQIISYAVFC